MKDWEVKALEEDRNGNGNTAVSILMKNSGVTISAALEHLNFLRKLDKLKNSGVSTLQAWEKIALELDSKGRQNAAVDIIRSHAGCGIEAALDYLHDLARHKEQEDFIDKVCGDQPLSGAETEAVSLTLMAAALQRLNMLDRGLDGKAKRG